MFIKISSGAHHNAALDKDGYIYTWGDSSAGCLGHEKTNDRDVPTPILTLSHKKVTLYYEIENIIMNRGLMLLVEKNSQQ